jgi:hypothetical protein
MGLQLTARRAKCWYLNVSEDSNGGGISGNVTYSWRVPVPPATLADCMVGHLGIPMDKAADSSACWSVGNEKRMGTYVVVVAVAVAVVVVVL